ncbi:T9SS type A sorting domain-containing protein [candidate division WOR-3 bacterium]|nr:T9SS type A sorting domain-containing protein [candidate division WOR-3 bacterium]
MMFVRILRIHTVYFLVLLVLGYINGLRATTYEVGPGMDYENIGDVPWESINPGDSVCIHYRTNPYYEKWVVARTGTESENIVIHGVPGSGGELPIINGQNATTRQELNYWSEERGIINIGGSSYPNQIPDYVVIENLDIRSARTPYLFTDDQGQVREYANNASSIYVIEGSHTVIRNCIFHDCGNGFFVSHAASDVIVERCYIYDNGIEGSYYHHNNYTEAKGITFQYNHFGPLRANCGGNNLKDRSCGTVVRYNWIEYGNRQLDLVESDHSEIYNDPSYSKTFVYGNIIIEQIDEGNSQICHYGGDGGNSAQYRKGTLFFYNNTVISKRSGNTTLFRLSTNDEFCDARNNVVYVTADGNRLAMLNTLGVLNIRNNWFKTGWVESHQGGNYQGTVIDSGGIVTGDLPGFIDWGTEDYNLAEGSPCINAGTSLSGEVLPEHNVVRQYIKHRQDEERPYDGTLDIGAYEYDQGGIAEELPVDVYPNPCKVFMGYNFVTFNNISPDCIIKMYDVTGRLVNNSGQISSMVYRWNVSNISSGLYFYIVQSSGDEKVASGKIVVIK